MAISYGMDVLTIGRVAENTGGGAAVEGCHAAVLGTDPKTQVKIAGANGNVIGAIVGALGETFDAGKPVNVQIMGVAPMVTGGVVTAGQFVESDGNGHIINSDTDKNRCIGVALESSSGTGEVIPVLLAPCIYGK